MDDRDRFWNERGAANPVAVQETEKRMDWTGAPTSAKPGAVLGPLLTVIGLVLIAVGFYFRVLSGFGRWPTIIADDTRSRRRLARDPSTTLDVRISVAATARRPTRPARRA